MGSSSESSTRQRFIIGWCDGNEPVTRVLGMSWPPLWAEMMRQEPPEFRQLSRLGAKPGMEQQARVRRGTFAVGLASVGRTKGHALGESVTALGLKFWLTFDGRTNMTALQMVRSRRWVLGALALLGLEAHCRAVRSDAFVNSGSLEGVTIYLSQLALALCPGLAVAGGGFALYKRRECRPKPMWYITAAIFVMLALCLPLVLPEAPKAQAPAEPRHSGELTLQRGQIVLVSDPRGGREKEGWQQALWTSMAEALQKGEEQVVMVFTRPACPWCEKLHPVLEGAIKRRQEAMGSVPEDAPPLLKAPLRVFVFDASEFSPIMRRFGVEGFPTLFFFGPPGSRPTTVPGYLGDEDFDKVLMAAASAEVEPPPEERRKRRGLFR
ncbi:unnamed protein product [Effrenium voratum]|uniref:Thioredoxin domain-containing protein n=1 Tax=Effrenium voratum TaxID=2562239 RepID=A0AA36ILH4_9DINO|nr:unnamed protein product [Effrenium voratum]